MLIAHGVNLATELLATLITIEFTIIVILFHLSYFVRI